MHFFNQGFALLHIKLVWSQVQLYQTNFQILLEYLEMSLKQTWLSWWPLFINSSADPGPLLPLSGDSEKFMANIYRHTWYGGASLLRVSQHRAIMPQCWGAQGQKIQWGCGLSKTRKDCLRPSSSYLMWEQIHFLGYKVSSLSHCFCSVLFNYLIWKSVAI